MSALADPDVASLLRLLRPGERVYLPGSTGEVPSLMVAMCSEDAPPLDVTASFVPGINPDPTGGLPEGTVFRNPFGYGPRGSQAAGRMAQVPMSYGAFAAHLQRAEIDTCVVHVAPPDARGRTSLGAAVEFTPIALCRARRTIAVVNPQVPRVPGAASVTLSEIAHVIEADAPLREYDVGAPTAQSDAIAEGIARFVRDGAALQIGLGKVPDALLRRLTDRRGLRLWSGMLSDAVRALEEAGALDPGWPHTSCVHVGSGAHYEWLRDRGGFAVRSCAETHDAAALARVGGLVAVNGALSVDLFGQANLETLGGRAVSGVGGAADFARSASLVPDGLSVLGLPAASNDGSASRIVARLDGPCSLPRQDVEVVVTEHGAADLRGASVMERAERLIAVAAPRHQGALTDAWREIAARL